ncbi:KTSC domain-containing protein, partial [Mesorhizobium sp. M1143]|uniref:KTSC domain-containing protein n=4 Tax=Mesorhizobium TaxID=68287 RepID=UPI003339E836
RKARPHIRIQFQPVAGDPTRLAEFGWHTMPSTSIRKFDYDPSTRVLSVWFVASGKHYEFLDVPAEAFAAFKAAFAKGVYFNSHIRNRYAFRLAAGRVAPASGD